MDLGLKGKVAIVGGASKGLGRACASVLAEEGAKLALCSRTEADLNQAAEEISRDNGVEVSVFPGNLDSAETIRDLVRNTVDTFGRLDILVNNSGGPPLARAETANEDQWATALQRSLLFFARMCPRGYPSPQNWGRRAHH